MKVYILSVIGLFMACCRLCAQDSLKSYALAEVVVTGQYEPQSLSKSVYQVRTIPFERIQAKGAFSLQDLLNTELNFRFSQDLALGTSSINMNGLSGQYVKILVDGVPVVGKSSGNEIDLNQINVNTIERIEIVEGPMSVAFGADALAGVINIITRKAYENKMSLQARVQEESVGKEYSGSQGIHNQYVSFSYAGSKWYTKAEAGRNYLGGFTGDATGREKQWHPKTQWLGGAVAGFRQDKLNVYYRLDLMDESIYNPGEFQGNQALDQRYLVNRFMHQVQGEATLNSRLTYNGAVAFTDYSRKTQSVNVDKATGRETLSLGAGQQDRNTFEGLTARGTFQYKISSVLSVQPGYDLNLENGEGGRLKAGPHTIGDYAIFVSAEYTPNKIFSIRPGMRMIRNSQYDAPPVVPSVNTKFNLSKKVDLRVSYGRGFRSPSLRELYFNFFDASHAIEGNPDLEPEYSHSLNTSVNWKSIEKETFTLRHGVSGFYTLVDNMIASGYLPGNNAVTTYINIARYKSQGIVLTNSLQVSNLYVTGGFSYTGRYNDFEEDDNTLPEYMWLPEANASLSYSFQKIGLSANVYYKYTGKLPYYEMATEDTEEIIRVATIGSFQWADVSLQKKAFQYLDITLGVRNLFNVVSVRNSTLNTGSAHSSGVTRPVGYGRSFFVSLIFSLNQ